MKRIEKHLEILYVIAFLMVSVINTSNAQEGNTAKDLDGNTYKMIKIGNQTWMAENLKTTKFSDGTTIPLVIDNAAWLGLNTPAYCWYDNDSTYKKTYGALYNGYTVNTGKLCPTGWHISSDAEWSALITYLGGDNIAGGKLKEKGTIHWSGPNPEATNESGFTALPGGSRYSNGFYFTIKNLGYWWTSIEGKTLNGWYRSIYNRNSVVSRNYYDLTNGFSVRCVKD
jgi:uncharacterized protein (TIGR02145 family)